MILDTGTGRLGYDTAGSGPAVVLSHAGLADRRMWRTQLCALAGRYRVVAFDRPGFGQSSAAPATVRHGEQLLRVLDALGVDRAALVGSSMGGGYSLDAAMLDPARVRALVLICSGVPGYEWPAQMLAEIGPQLSAAVPADRLAAYAAHTAERVLDEDVAAMAEAQSRYLTVGPGRTPDDLDPAGWALALEMSRGVFAREWGEPATAEIDPEPPLLDRLGEIAVPTLVINGRYDVRFVQDLSDRLAGGIPGAMRIDLDAAHLPPLEAPEQVNAALLDFLAGPA